MVNAGIRRGAFLAALGVGSMAAASLAQSSARPGVTVQYVQLGSAGGIEGRAYLPTTPSWTSTETSPCGRRYEMTAKARTGQVREVRVVIEAARVGTIDLSSTGCPRASLEASLDDGSTVSSREGSVDVRTLPAADSPLVASFEWSTMRGGQPMPIRGHIVIPATAP